MISEIHNCDCMEYMKTMPDNWFDLAIADPPYGIGASNYIRGGTRSKSQKTKCRVYQIKDWDNFKPNKEFFKEIMRVSKNQIIWGGNYYDLPPSSAFIVWDKVNYNNSYSDCELAWTSFKGRVRQFTFQWCGMLQGDMKNKENRIHPTQKPVKLYAWILKNYAKEGDRIFDPMMGSGSSRIAAYKMGFDFYGCEIDKDYFEASNQRFELECKGVYHTPNGEYKQLDLF